MKNIGSLFCTKFQSKICAYSKKIKFGPCARKRAGAPGSHLPQGRWLWRFHLGGLVGAESALSGGRYGIGEVISTAVIFAHHLVELPLGDSTGGEIYAIDLVYSDSESVGVFHKKFSFHFVGGICPPFSVGVYPRAFS